MKEILKVVKKMKKISADLMQCEDKEFKLPILSE